MSDHSSSRAQSVVLVVGLVVILGLVIVGARVVGSRSVDDSTARAEAKERADGIVNRLSVVNMLDTRIRLSITDVIADEWGRTPPNDEPPAGLEALVIEPQRVSPEAGLRPLRIADGGGDATFTIEVQRDDATRIAIAEVPTRSSSLEYCTPNKCVDGYAWFDWQSAPDPPLDVFRHCVEDDRIVGSYTDATGATRAVHAVFQCDATRFRTTLVLHD